MKREYPALDMNMIKSKQRKTISSKDALQDITPIEWGDDVTAGRVKIYVTELNEDNPCVK